MCRTWGMDQGWVGPSRDVENLACGSVVGGSRSGMCRTWRMDQEWVGPGVGMCRTWRMDQGWVGPGVGMCKTNHPTAGGSKSGERA